MNTLTRQKYLIAICNKSLLLLLNTPYVFQTGVRIYLYIETNWMSFNIINHLILNTSFQTFRQLHYTVLIKLKYVFFTKVYFHFQFTFDRLCVKFFVIRFIFYFDNQIRVFEIIYYNKNSRVIYIYIYRCEKR